MYERWMWAAVLGLAIIDYRKQGKFRASANYWLFEGLETGVGSLYWICDLLQLNVDYVRRSVNNGNVRDIYSCRGNYAGDK